MKKNSGVLAALALLVIAACIFVLSSTAQAASTSDLTFTLNATGDGYIVFECDESVTGGLVIPDTYNGKPVTRIETYAFRDCTGLTGVIIPDSVTSIGNGAFYNCSSLTSITIPDSVTSIVFNTFRFCSGLTSITIPDGVTDIGNSAFEFCSGLTSITIPNSVISIGRYAFNGCSGLDKVIYCGTEEQWNAIAISSDNHMLSWATQQFHNYENGSCTACGVLDASKILTFTLNDAGDGYVVSKCDTAATGERVIPATYNGKPVTAIGDYAFEDCRSLTSITIPDGITSIGKYAFRDCTGLTSITIPNSVTSIGVSAFYGCKSLTSITIPDSITSIGERVFYDCRSLTSITIPDSVTAIGEYAFHNCFGLTSITIPDSVTSIGAYAFYDCSGLTSITIPNGVTRINYEAFATCTNLTSVTIPNSVTSIEAGAFLNCVKLTDITIPDSVTYIGDDAFFYCTSLTSITIPDSVTSIGDYAFLECCSLTSVIYCGTQEQWNSLSIGSDNEALTNAALQFHNIENGICSFCGKTECEALEHAWLAADCETPKTCNRCQATEGEASGHKYENGICSVCQNYAVFISVSNSTFYRGDTVTVTVSTSAIEHCTVGGFLFSYDTSIFEYVNGKALVSGFSAAGVSTANDKIAGYFMNGNETLEGEIFQITLRVKEDAVFADYTVSGIASFTVNVGGASEKIDCEVSDATGTIACRHSYGEWIPIDEVWHKHICTICSYEETAYVEYTVTFRYADGTVISSEVYCYGDTVVVPDAPPAQAANQKFIGWDREITTCTGDATYTAVFEEYAPGDINGDKTVDHNDAIYLLLHTMFGQTNYPLGSADADIDGNGTVNQEDAVYLLLHTLFGEVFYPLT